MKLTAKTIDTIQVLGNAAERIVYDDEIPGFGVRVRKAGSRNFVFTYRFAGSNKRLTLGSAVKEAFPDIRKRVLELQAKVRMGIDPGAERDTNRSQAVDTFKAIADRFLAVYRTTVKPATYSETERYLLKTAERLHGKPIATVTRRDVAETLSAAAANVTKGTGLVTANRLRAALSTLFSWAMKEGLAEHNPTIGTYMRREEERERVLSIDELVTIWKALDDDAFGGIVKLLMLTAQRKSEIGDLRWEELDQDQSRITLPRQRTKNGLEHIVPLSESAREILSARPLVVGQACVFAERSNTGFTPWDAYKKALDAKLPGKAPWTIHDLRRSAATHMAERCGVLPHVVEAILNHQSGSKRGVAKIYNRATYLAEKTTALTLWAEYLMAAVSGETAKVVPLRVNA